MHARSTTWLATCAVLIVLAAGPYLQTHAFDFIGFDDNEFITDNPTIQAGVTLPGLWWASRAVVVANWHPLTLLSHMIDCDLYLQPDGSQWPGGHHLTSVAFHVMNTVLLLWALWMLTGAFWRPALVAALYAVHPQHVESVAWIAERKDVLSTFFGFLALGTYAWHAQQPSWRRMGLVTLCLLLSLMSKPMWVTFPFVVLLLDIWPLRRVKVWDVGKVQAEREILSAKVPSYRTIKQALVEKIPLFALIVFSSALTVFLQSTVGAASSVSMLAIPARIINAIVAYAAYLQKFVWPANLAIYYPHPTTWPLETILGSVVVLGALTGLALWQRSARPWILICWLLYLGMLVPVIGLVQVGDQFMADRYMYVPSIWMCMMVVWSVPTRGTARSVAGVASACIVIVLTVACHGQTTYWRDTRTLFTRALEVTNRNAMAHIVLADDYADRNDHQTADMHFKAALDIRPNFVFALGRYALFLINLERYDEALDVLKRQMSLQETAFAPHQAGIIHMKRGEWNDAERAFGRALELDPANTMRSRENLANTLVQQGRLDEAQAQLIRAQSENPHSFEVHNSLGAIKFMQGRFAEAVDSFDLALKIDPHNWETLANHGRALVELGRFEQAVDSLSKAQEGHPERLFIRTNLARALAATGRTDEAVAILQEVLMRSPGFAPAVTALSQIQSAAPSSTPGS